MGTSQAASAPITADWTRRVPSALRSPTHNPVTIADAVLSSTLPLLIHRDQITVSLFSLNCESIRFLTACRSEGLEKAAEKYKIKISPTYVASSIAKGLCDTAQSQIESKLVNSPYGKIAERAMSKTISSIVANGAKAMVGDNNE